MEQKEIAEQANELLIILKPQRRIELLAEQYFKLTDSQKDSFLRTINCE